MSITKHKIFKIKVSDDGKFTISKTVENTINTFLSEENNVYVNHSITTLTEDVEEYDNLKTICKYVYKNKLKPAFILLKKNLLSKKMKDAITKTIINYL